MALWPGYLVQCIYCKPIYPLHMGPLKNIMKKDLKKNLPILALQ